MYISVRECLLPPVFGSIRAGLDAMGIDAVELEYFRDRTVFSIDSTTGETVSLADDAAIDGFIAKAATLNIKVSALLLHNNFGAEDLETELDWVISCLRTAEKLGAKAVRIDAIMSTEHEWLLEKRIDRFAECTARILEATDGLGVAMGIENHGLQGNQPEFLDSVLGRVNHPRVGMNLDTANFYWYGHPLAKVHEIIKHFAPKVKHTHLKNISFPEDKRNGLPEIGWGYMEYASTLRQGNIDIPRVISTLRAAGYDGDLCIEDESLHRWDEAGRKEALVDDARYLREVMGDR